jgi:uncharacterized membrane protein YdbT with pleckstrin-like domain
MGNDLKAWAQDTAERTVFTFLQSFIGLIIVSATNTVDSLNVSTIEAALVSSVISALAVLKGALANRVHGVSPASFLPYHDDDVE